MQKSIQRLPIIAMLAMAILTFSNFVGLNIAGVVVFIGVGFFFIMMILEKKQFAGSGLDLSSLKTDLKGYKIWIWIVLPLIMDIVSMTIGKLFFPGYVTYIVERAGGFITYDKIPLLVVQLLVLALGEEIAWRAFFQKRLNKYIGIVPVLLLSGILFGLGHYAEGDTVIVIMNIFFIIINSILYGIIFKISKNAWVCTISHFIANLFSIVVLVLL